MPLDRAFYERPARTLARDLLGCVLVSRCGGAITSGSIVETEAYLGPADAASHAAFRPGSRGLFYGPGGIAYVFRAYGIHDCLNAIAGRIGQPGCVLIRALEPLEGAAVMAERRGVSAHSRRLASGPGNLTRALGVTRRDSGSDLTCRTAHHRARRWLPSQARRHGASGRHHRATARILRFWIPGNPHVSRGT